MADITESAAEIATPAGYGATIALVFPAVIQRALRNSLRQFLATDIDSETSSIGGGGGGGEGGCERREGGGAERRGRGEEKKVCVCVCVGGGGGGGGGGGLVTHPLSSKTAFPGAVHAAVAYYA